MGELVEQGVPQGSNLQGPELISKRGRDEEDGRAFQSHNSLEKEKEGNGAQRFNRVEVFHRLRGGWSVAEMATRRKKKIINQNQL